MQQLDNAKIIVYTTPILESHADRFKYGTDFDNYPTTDEEKLRTKKLNQPRIIRNFMETDIEHDANGRIFHGINLDSNLLRKMYYENSAKEYGDPKPISKAFVADELDHLLPTCSEAEHYDLDLIAAHFGL